MPDMQVRTGKKSTMRKMTSHELRLAEILEKQLWRDQSRGVKLKYRFVHGHHIFYYESVQASPLLERKAP